MDRLGLDGAVEALRLEPLVPVLGGFGHVAGKAGRDEVLFHRQAALDLGHDVIERRLPDGQRLAAVGALVIPAQQDLITKP